jgi:molybdopterin-guanine dinucleotide biosynthesis protein B
MKLAFGFAGWSGSGKTTLIEKVIPRLVDMGLRVSLIKQARVDFDVDQPGKDSHRHRLAGAREVLVHSSRRWVLMHELRGTDEPTLSEQIERLSVCDVVIVEGVRDAPIPTIEVWRPETGKTLRHSDHPSVVAIATDAPIQAEVPILDMNDAEVVARFICSTLGLLCAREPRSGTLYPCLSAAC